MVAQLFDMYNICIQPVVFELRVQVFTNVILERVCDAYLNPQLTSHISHTILTKRINIYLIVEQLFVR